MTNLSHFYFSEITICSSIELHELPPTSPPAEISFQFDPSSPPPTREQDRIHSWPTPEGETAFSCFRTKSGYHLRFPDRADFTIAPDGSSIRGFTAGEADLEAVRHDLLAQVLPRVLSHRGHLALHASAVSTSHGAIAFLGDTGAGKSTVAASLASSGFAAISDDCLVLDLANGPARGVPTFRSPRLWPDSAAGLIDPESLSDLPSEPSGKVSLSNYRDSEKDHSSSHQLAAAFVLDPTAESDGPGSPFLETLSPAEALMSLAEHSFQLDITDRPSQERRLELFSQVAQEVPTYRLVYEQEYSGLDRVKRTVLDQLAARD